MRAVHHALRYAGASLALLLLLIIGLAVSGLVHIPATAVLLWSLVLPVALGGIIGGLLAPLAPGILTIWSDRFEIGDHILIGPVSNPLAQGVVIERNPYLTRLADDKAGVVTVTCQTIHGLTVTQLPPLPRA